MAVQPYSLSDVGLETVVTRLSYLLDGETLSPDDLVGVVEAVEQRLVARELPPPGGLELLVSERCNLRCDYCFLGQGRGGTMDVEVASAALGLLRVGERADPEVSVCLFGGEPLTNPDVVEWVLTEGFPRLRDAGLAPRATMTTNGTLVTDAVATLLASHGVVVMVSIDGEAATHDLHRPLASGASSHALATAGAVLLRDAGVPVTIRVTVSPDCVDQVQDSIGFALSLRPATVLARPVDGIVWPDDAWRRLGDALCRVQSDRASAQGEPQLHLIGDYRDVAGWGCGAGGGTLAVGYDGTVVPCSVFLGDARLRADYALGNVRDDAPEAILGAGRRRELVALISRPGPECSDCELAPHCAGGCPGHSFGTTGGFVHRDPTCCADTSLRRRLSEQAGQPGGGGASGSMAGGAHA